MTTKGNRLLDDGYEGGSTTNRDVSPGETVTIRVKDGDGKDTGEPIVFIRTNRAYAYDLADAYNARRKTRHSPYWYVDAQGNVRPGDPPRHTEVWKPDPAEIEATNQVAARAVAAGISGEEWTRLVNNGGITKEVFKTMHENAARASEEAAE